MSWAMSVRRPPRFTPRRDAGLYGFERALEHGGFDLVAGVDEAGRGACAGPLVVAAVILRPGRRGEIEGLADSKLLTPRRREEIYAEVVARALAWSAVVIPCEEIDRIGLHRCNIAGMRRAVTRLETRPAYVLSDGFPVPGLEVPALAVTKGDRVAACVAAASVVAKVTRDRLMVELHDRFPAYGFHVHKGYITPEHSAALAAHGPCPQHRFSFVNVARLTGAQTGGPLVEGTTAGGPPGEGTPAEGMSPDEVPADAVQAEGTPEGGIPESVAGKPEDDQQSAGTPEDGRRAVEAGMQDNGAGAVGRADGNGATLRGVAERAGVA
ncbi:ribonuclease HII [Actinomadura scrupuli]|uniref:ribonuclease HII n=1 Tax=Actinomadura scrupuli TaxID=559629 RepID=UPI003D9808D0